MNTLHRRQLIQHLGLSAASQTQRTTGGAKVFVTRSPSPRPSPPGEGESSAVSGENLRLSLHDAPAITQPVQSLFPLPGGEGQGEGERQTNFNFQSAAATTRN